MNDAVDRDVASIAGSTTCPLPGISLSRLSMSAYVSKLLMQRAVFLSEKLSREATALLVNREYPYVDTFILRSERFYVKMFLKHTHTSTTLSGTSASTAAFGFLGGRYGRL